MKRANWKRPVSLVVLSAWLAFSLAISSGMPNLAAAPPSQEGPVQTASSLTLVPTGSTTVQEAHPTTNYNYSVSPGLTLGRIGGGRSRGLVEFNIGEIPLGATINSATLYIYQGGWYDVSGSARTIYADRVTSAWHEAVATWGYAPTVGATAASVTVGMSEGWYAMDVTALVREWYTGTTPDYGLLLRGYEGSGNLYREFVQRFYEDEPELAVDYTPQSTTLDVSTHSVSFKTDGLQTEPSPAIAHVINRGSGWMNWSIQNSAPWLSVDQTSGFTSASYNTPVEVSVLTGTLSPGTYTAPLTITASGAANSPQVVQVTLNYSASPFRETYLPLVLRGSTGSGSGGGSPSPSSPMVTLSIGIADYYYLEPPPPGAARTGDWGYDAEFTHDDPNFIQKLFMAFAAVIADHTRAVTDKEAAKAAIQQDFVWLDEEEENAVCPFGLAQLGAQACSSGPARVFFSYSGHGMRDAAGNYLIAAYDTNESGGYFTNGISGATLDSWLDTLESSQVLVAIDACHSGGLLPALAQTGRAVLAASGSDQSSWEVNEFRGGVFTHYLVQGLMDPRADTNHDGCVSAGEAYSYAAPRTDSYVYALTGTHQNPQMSNLVPGEFCLTYLPSYGAMAAAQAVTSEEVQPVPGAV
jgi:hypothetical protein